jgi:sigma-54 specific flagellar transcriptional regulator A
MQVKMLRTLQEKTVERVGSGRSIQVDTRIVAATNRCLETAVETGQFREDLFYRLNVYPIVVPPLRERGEDVLELFAHLADGFAFEGFEPITLHAKAASHLLRRQWPGNVRELSNLVERLSIRYPGEEITEAMLPAERKRRIQPLECLPPMPAQSVSPFHPATPNYGNIWPEAPAEVRSHAGDSATSVEEHAALWGREVPVSESGAGAADVSLSDLAGNGIDLKEHLRKIEVGFIEQALEHHKGNVTLAAERLGLRRTTLIEKIKKHEIRPRA